MSGLPCLVVGGGRVGTRKSLKLLDYGAQVTVLAPEVSGGLLQQVERRTVHWLREEYDPSAVQGYWLVVAATSDDALNAQIGRQAEEAGALACVTSEGRLGRTIFPALHSHDQVCIAVHSHAKHCGRSREVRDRIASALSGEELPAEHLVMVGVSRSAVPEKLFAALRGACTEEGPAAVLDSAILVLETCQRWQCYGLTPYPEGFRRRVLGWIRSRCQGAAEALSQAFALKVGAAAYHHLVRVAGGLDSPLRGETEIVGQVRGAVRQWVSREAPLREEFEAALRAQKSIRRDSGLGADSPSWADAVVRLLLEQVGQEDVRSVGLLGCGGLARGIARRLLSRNVRVLPFSRRARAGGVDWCTEEGHTVRAPEELVEFAGRLDAAVLSSAPSEELREVMAARCASGSLFVVDLTAAQATALPRWVGLEAVGRRPVSPADAAQIAEAEFLAFEHALRREADRNGGLWSPAALRLGGRVSRLSTAQIEQARRLLEVLLPRTRVEVVRMGTPCDRDQTTPLLEVEGSDFFTRDLDLALVEGRIDIAVHSAKDLPQRIPRGVVVGGLTPAFAPWDCLVSRDGQNLHDLPAGAQVGTSSERRRTRLQALRPDLVCRDVRGNVPDRLTQLDDGKFDALVLAAAGLIRLGQIERIAQVFSLQRFPPAPGQGALALTVRCDDRRLCNALRPMDLGNREGLPWAREESR